MTHPEYIVHMAKLIDKTKGSYGNYPTSPILAQAILESGWGRSSLAAKYHNHFGMKCGSSYKGASVNLATKEEYTPGTLTDIRANFRAYPNDEVGVRGYFVFIQSRRYANLNGCLDPEEYCRRIKADGWATSTKYADNLINLIRNYNLTQYDDLAHGSSDTIKYFPAASYSGRSIIDGLKSIGAESSFAYRATVAACNGINNYKGTASQNTAMLKLLRAGKLVRP